MKHDIIDQTVYAGMKLLANNNAMEEGLGIVGLLDTFAGSKDTILLAAFRPRVALLRAALLTCKSYPLSVESYRTNIIYLY